MTYINVIYDFLSSFFAVFNAHVNEYRIVDQKVYGNIEWNDENERQAFIWHIELEASIIPKLKTLCDFLIKYNLIKGDRIIVSEETLKEKLIALGWDLSEAERNINHLCTVEVKMIDNGEETDSFFIHF